MASERRIVVKSYLNVRNEFVAKEALAPGQAAELASDGKLEAVDAAKTPLSFIVVEDELQGNEIKDSYKTGDTLIAWTPTPGDVGLVRVGNSTNNKVTFAAPGDLIGLGTAGSVVKLAASPEDTVSSSKVKASRPVAIALEDLAIPANGGSGTAYEYLKVMFI